MGFFLPWQIKIIEERVHFLEYGLLGWLVTEIALKSLRVQEFMSSLVIPSFLSWLSEFWTNFSNGGYQQE